MQVYAPKVRSRAGETLTFANELYKALESAAPNVQNPSQKTLLCAAVAAAVAVAVAVCGRCCCCGCGWWLAVAVALAGWAGPSVSDAHTPAK